MIDRVEVALAKRNGLLRTTNYNLPTLFRRNNCAVFLPPVIILLQSFRLQLQMAHVLKNRGVHYKMEVEQTQQEERGGSCASLMRFFCRARNPLKEIHVPLKAERNEERGVHWSSHVLSFLRKRFRMRISTYAKKTSAMKTNGFKRQNWLS